MGKKSTSPAAGAPPSAKRAPGKHHHHKKHQKRVQATVEIEAVSKKAAFPVVVSFYGAAPPSSVFQPEDEDDTLKVTVFREFKEKDGELTPVSTETCALSVRLETPEEFPVDYKGSSQKEQTCSRFMVARYNRASGKVTFGPQVPMVGLRPDSKRSAIDVPQRGEEEGFRAQRTALTNTFGSLKQQRKMNEIETFAITDDKMEGASDIQNLVVSRTASQDITRDVSIEARQKTLPPFDADARIPQECYPLGRLFSMSANNAAEENCEAIEQALAGEAELPEDGPDPKEKYPSFVRSLVVSLQGSESVRKDTNRAEVASLLMHYTFLYRFLILRDRKVLNQSSLLGEAVGADKNYGRYLQINLLSQLGEGGRAKYNKNMAKGVLNRMYMLVIALHLQNFTIRCSDLTKDLMSKPDVVNQLCREMGCRPPVRVVDGKKVRTMAGSEGRMQLFAPLKFPVESRRG